ncbi:hypothetical protein ASJ80_06095 [Methanobacterium bryantii]|uniref:Uncharacterized protein n=1 Tax=Methanobacterium bryantii TaxID=2161 RepID=A0A2A2H4R3_METBR|nr:hypothetical protein ASJ80_06095 [Methanobacterium bryantii]
MKLASQTPKIYIKIFECSENLKEIFFNLKKFIEFFGTFKRKAFDACKIFNFAAEETEFPPASEIYDFRKVKKCLQNLRFCNRKKLLKSLISMHRKFTEFSNASFFACLHFLKFEEFWGMQNFVLRLRSEASQTSKTYGF